MQSALAIAALAGLLLHRMGKSIIDVDLWHQLALGRVACELGYVPNSDLFAYTPTVFPSIHHEWGAGLVAYLIAVVGGGQGIAALRYLLAAALAVLCWCNARRAGAMTSTLVFLIPLAILLTAHGYSTVRAQMYSYVNVALLLCWLQLDREGKRWWIPAWLVQFVVFANLHAGFVVSCGLFFFHWLEQWRRGAPHVHLLAIGVSLPLLLALNPYGFELHTYLLHGLAMPRPHVQEWGRLWEIAPPGQVACFAASALIFLYALVQVGPAKAPGWPLVMVTMLASLSAHRILAFYAIVWLSLVPAYLASTPLAKGMENTWQEFRWGHAVLWGLATAYFAASLALAAPWRPLVPGQPIPGAGPHVIYPVGAIDYLAREKFAGNVFTPFDWGAYVSWKLAPQVKVSLDSRYEAAFTPEVEDEQYQFYMATAGWQQLLEKPGYRETAAILIRNGLPLDSAIRELPGWKQVYRDDSFQIYARADSTLPVTDATSRRFEGTLP